MWQDDWGKGGGGGEERSRGRREAQRTVEKPFVFLPPKTHLVKL